MFATGPWWLGLVDAAAVLAVLGVWLLLVDERWSSLRPVAGVAGVVLLALGAGQLLARMQSTMFQVALPHGAEADGFGPGPWLVALLIVLGVAAGILAATHGPGPDDVAEDDEPEPVDEEPEPEYVAPARLWSDAEVVGDAPHHDGSPPPAPEPRLRVDTLLSRGVAGPLLAVAFALALPVTGSVQRLPPGVRGSAHPWQYAYHALGGVLVGGALLGAALWLDVWERRLVAFAFAVLAAGVALEHAFTGTFANPYWVPFATGLAAGLFAAALVRVLRRLRAPGRAHLVAGAAIALVLVGGWGYAYARSYYASFVSFTSEEGG